MELESYQLGENMKMYVSEDHRFGTDAFLLAYYAGVKHTSTVCDLCTGCGIIPLILCKNASPRLVYALDIQKEAIDLLEMSVKENHLENVIAPICEDLRDIKGIAPESIDVVTVNPPYMSSGSGFERLSRAQAIARHEILCNIDDVCRATAKLLIFGGMMKMCQHPDRLTDVICAMRANKIEPKSITFVHNSISEKPWLFLVSGKKGAKPGIVIEKPMILRADDKSYTDEFRRIYE